MQAGQSRAARRACPRLPLAEEGLGQSQSTPGPSSLGIFRTLEMEAEGTSNPGQRGSPELDTRRKREASPHLHKSLYN